VQGEGGFVPATQELVEGIRAICDEHGIVMVCDEVQSGYARTGKFFAIEHYGVRPDLITVAKSIAMGIPLSGVLGKAAIMDAPQEGGVGGTYVGNPVAQAAALAVLDVIEEEGLVERSAALGETMRTRMLAWQERWPQIRDVRGLGAMLAIELDDAATASRVVEEALRGGLLLLKAGVEGRAIRVLVPLVVTDAELDEALGAWEDALDTVLA
jgi:4-aminobutyrate aminotransferase/(S)-3-amino-2-methylpropionate transaminase